MIHGFAFSWRWGMELASAVSLRAVSTGQCWKLWDNELLSASGNVW
jgi:hypothetical protein